MNQALITISGVNSDPDPSPGVGIARSLREAFPQAILTAVDYSVRSSGLHHPIFDSVLVQPVWSELDLTTYAQQIRAHLDQDLGCWISGLDVETGWLASALGDHSRLLIPNAAAQLVVKKPSLGCAPTLQMFVPEYLPALSAPTDLHALGRRSGWRLWVKGRYHEAYAAYSFPELRRQIRALEAHWPLDTIFIQQHVVGTERSFTFAAYDGQLLGAVEVEKRSVTAQGKTWAASVSLPTADVLERLSGFIHDTRWTGGGEVEFVRGMDGRDWLIDLNPRFPAYIHGITLCGHNLPALLVGAALDAEYLPATSPSSSRQFIRVVHELPVRQELSIPRMIAAPGVLPSMAKHPSYQPELVRRLSPANSEDNVVSERLPKTFPLFLARWQSRGRTPRRFRELELAEATLWGLMDALHKCGGEPRIIPALSVKTDPCRPLAKRFLEHSWWAEVISFEELEWAKAIGFEDSAIVVNGPRAQETISRLSRPVAAAFADSLEALEGLLESQQSRIVGLRVRPGTAPSRFGLDLTDMRTFKRVAQLLERCGSDQRLGVHVHFASDVLGPNQWEDLLEHCVVWTNALSEASGALFSAFDIGGGWHADDFRDHLIPALPRLQERIARAIPSIETILIEPGKAVAAESAWLVSRILEVRAGNEGIDDVVVDASIADLPMAPLYSHRIIHLRNGKCLGWLGGGRKRILGAICMETDILADGVGFPQPPAQGDELLFASAGGYNASMAWHFAAGVSRDSK
ncbi:MAG: hypothetical protein ACJ76Y_21420 [Thermoanaerobaculia bacterium]